jgi:hypothetical protein
MSEPRLIGAIEENVFRSDRSRPHQISSFRYLTGWVWFFVVGALAGLPGFALRASSSLAQCRLSASILGCFSIHLR